MAKYIHWYLVELEGMLRGEVRNDQLHDILAETESHLRDSAEDLASKGMGPDQAEIAALEKFGRIRTFANRTLEGVPTRTANTLLVLGTSVAALPAFTWAVLHARGIPRDPQFGIWELIVGGAFICAGSWFATTSRARLLLASGLLVLAACFLVTRPIATRGAAVARQNAIPRYRDLKAAFSPELEKVKRGVLATRQGQWLPEFEEGGTYLAPSRIALSFTDWRLLSPAGSDQYLTPQPGRTRVEYASYPTWAKAAKAWKSSGEMVYSDFVELWEKCDMFASTDPRRTINSDFTRTGAWIAADSTATASVLVLASVLLNFAISRLRLLLRRSPLRAKLA